MARTVSEEKQHAADLQACRRMVSRGERPGYRLTAAQDGSWRVVGVTVALGQASYKKLGHWWSHGENASFTGDADRLADFVEDDIVLMNVVGGGSLSYDTQAGGNTTVPFFEIAEISPGQPCTAGRVPF